MAKKKKKKRNVTDFSFEVSNPMYKIYLKQIDTDIINTKKKKKEIRFNTIRFLNKTFFSR